MTRQRLKHLVAPGIEGVKIGPFGSSLTKDRLMDEGVKVYGQENVIYDDFQRGWRHLSKEEAHEFSSYLVAPGDVLVSMMGTIGRCAIVPASAETGIMDSHLLRVRPNRAVLESRFLRYCLEGAAPVVQRLKAAAAGATMDGLNSGKLRELEVPAPSPAAQLGIIAYLDRETQRIDALIQAKEDQLQLLEEQKTAQLDALVSGTGEPDANVLGLRQLPSGWQVKKLKLLAEVRSGTMVGKDLRGVRTITVPYLRVANVQDGFLDLTEIKEIHLEESAAERFLLKAGDILMNEGGDEDKLGRGAIWDGSINPCAHQNHVYAVRSKGEVEPEWIAMLSRAPYLKAFFETHAKRTTGIASISSTNLGKAPIVVPPAAERVRILEQWAEIERRSNVLRDHVATSIALLRERRQAVITAAVTGELQVPEVAA